MTNVIKDGIIMAARDEHQLAAFLNNGWKKMEEGEQEFKLPFTPPETEEDAGQDEKPKDDAKTYTKTDIKKMKLSDLQSLATAEGIENAAETSGEGLKEILIKHFGL